MQDVRIIIVAVTVTILLHFLRVSISETAERRRLVCSLQIAESRTAKSCSFVSFHTYGDFNSLCSHINTKEYQK
jgi:hypothetical protein